jgi:NH(3)-dependent NAD(+) synthetase
MGLTYKEADQVLYRMLEENKTVEEILNEGFDKSLVENIVRRMNRSEYKRRMPLIAKIKR